ncbi:MAG: hypothetical protein EPN79_11480 [Burkholderiaceae bacterium]|nr:MAG: hypothetical protein EPN79_11480 [Burkholderiaceae bacterium]TBR76694.1 MAG: hypothetical protein EPN64_05585 [Burkholderiaceae bacterium]
MPAAVTKTAPQVPWKLYADIGDVPKKGFRAIEVEAIAIEEEMDGKYFLTRIVTSPLDGPLAMCSVYLRHDDGLAQCIADLPSKEAALAYAQEVRGNRKIPIDGVIFELRAFNVPGKGYLADQRLTAGSPHTTDPAKAALYHDSETEHFMTENPSARGRWVSWVEAKELSVDRAAEKEDLLQRVYTAALVAMGPECAPQWGSADSAAFRLKLGEAIESTRLDRLVIFDVEQRRDIQSLLIDNGFEVDGGETDEEICDMLMRSDPGFIFNSMDWGTDPVQKLMASLTSAAGITAIRTAIGSTPKECQSAMLRAIHRHLLSHGKESPFSDLMADEETTQSAEPPRG